MKLLWSNLFIILFLSISLNVAKAMSVSHKGTKFNFTLSNGKLLAVQNGNKFSGRLKNRIGDFSHWIFILNEKEYSGFEIIINEKSSKILDQKHILEAGGPFLAAASPDSKIVIFDYGTASGPRDLEMRDGEGKILLKDSYIDEIKWTGKSFEYEIPKSVPIDLNEETKACDAVGAAWEIERYSFDGKNKIKLFTPLRVFKCSN